MWVGEIQQSDNDKENGEYMETTFGFLNLICKATKYDIITELICKSTFSWSYIKLEYSRYG